MSSLGTWTSLDTMAGLPWLQASIRHPDTVLTSTPRDRHSSSFSTLLSWQHLMKQLVISFWSITLISSDLSWKYFFTISFSFFSSRYSAERKYITYLLLINFSLDPFNKLELGSYAPANIALSSIRQEVEREEPLGQLGQQLVHWGQQQLHRQCRGR